VWACESLTMTAKMRQTEVRGVEPTQFAFTFDSAPANKVIAFPVFEQNGDQIREWLSDIGNRQPSRRAVVRLAKSMRCTADRIERVRNSIRHSNLAKFVRHAAAALEASEWEGARYLLIMSLTLMKIRPVPAEGFGHATKVRQLPVAAMGIVTG
jgi:hypothetical protein